MKYLLSSLFVLPLFFLSGCFSSEKKSSPLQELVEEQRNIQNEKSAYFSIEHNLENIYSVFLNNPKKEAIQSLQFSLIVPKHLAEISDFKLNEKTEELFPLLLEGYSTSGLLNIDDNANLLISIAQKGKAMHIDEKLEIASFIVEKTKNSPFQISFFNDEKGNKVNIIENTKIKNILNIDSLENLIVQ